MKKIQITLMITLCAVTLFGQSKEGTETCEKLLQGGLYSFTGMTNTGSFSQDLRTYLLSEKFKKEIKNGKWGTSITIPIKGVPVTLGANDSEEKYNEFTSKVLSETNLSIKSDYYQTTYSSIPNTNLYEAFNQCIQTVSNVNSIGFLPVKELVTEEYVVFTIVYRPQIPTDGMPKVEFFKVENATTVSNPLSIGSILSPSTIITAKREPEKDLILTIQTDRGTISRKIDAENSLSSSKELPIGTVISSFLSFDQFNFASKNNAKSPGELWTSVKSKWAPCDGRSVNNSGFAKITSKEFVPDLRGMFLRGLNTFDPANGPAPRNANEADPENRVVGQFQNDEIKSHNHGIPYPIIGAGGSKGPDGNNFKSYGNPGMTTPFGKEETRPKNVSIYYYIKIN